MSRSVTHCFYCDGVVTTKGIGDHLPIPQRHGGLDAVPCCVSCHDMKDRLPLEQWPISWSVAIMADMPKMSRETKLFLAKSMMLCMDAMETLRCAK